MLFTIQSTPSVQTFPVTSPLSLVMTLYIIYLPLPVASVLSNVVLQLKTGTITSPPPCSRHSWEVSPSKDKTKIIWSLQLMLLWEKYQVPKSCYLQIIPHFTKCFNHFSTRLPTKETRVHIAKVHGRNVGWHRRQEVGSYPETKEFFSEIQQLAPSLRGAFFLFLPHY